MRLDDTWMEDSYSNLLSIQLTTKQLITTDKNKTIVPPSGLKYPEKKIVIAPGIMTTKQIIKIPFPVS